MSAIENRAKLLAAALYNCPTSWHTLRRAFTNFISTFRSFPKRSPAMRKKLSRRRFLPATCAGAAATSLHARHTSASHTIIANNDIPALLGGPPVRRTPFTAWPIIGEAEEKQLLEVLHNRK